MYLYICVDAYVHTCIMHMYTHVLCILCTITFTNYNNNNYYTLLKYLMKFKRVNIINVIYLYRFECHYGNREDNN